MAALLQPTNQLLIDAASIVACAAQHWQGADFHIGAVQGMQPPADFAFVSDVLKIGKTHGTCQALKCGGISEFSSYNFNGHTATLSDLLAAVWREGGMQKARSLGGFCTAIRTCTM